MPGEKIRKIVITGGHLTPAQAVIEELQREKTWEIYYFGRKFSLEGKSIPSPESIVIPKMGVKFITIPAGRLQRRFTPYTFISILRIPFSFFVSLILLAKIRPAVILSFGGYVSVPTVMAGWLLGIPVLTHEQTVVSGLANRVDGLFAKKILVSFPESLKDFSPGKVVLTGNPIRKEVFQLRVTGCGLEVAQEDLPLLYITGGSQGSQIINSAVAEILPQLLSKYRIIHQCGQLDFASIKHQISSIKYLFQKRYFAAPYIEAKDIGWVLHQADLVVSRAGANTVTELAALGKPAILIPIPRTSGNEQERNAQWLAEAGTALLLPQDQLSGQKLLEVIDLMISNLGKFKTNSQKAQQKIKLDAARRIVAEINKVLKTEK
jgi:UDP-N-acetylglucosamine--N-acetylmuramyl-(pentapeptide) pyrophosphoryl-undecaprenol N-acetylglucosamine transferase